MALSRAHQDKDVTPGVVFRIMKEFFTEEQRLKIAKTHIVFDYSLETKDPFRPKKAEVYKNLIINMRKVMGTGAPTKTTLASAIELFDREYSGHLSGFEDPVKRRLWALGEALKLRALLMQVWRLKNRTMTKAKSNVLMEVKKKWNAFDMPSPKASRVDCNSSEKSIVPKNEEVEYSASEWKEWMKTEDGCVVLANGEAVVHKDVLMDAVEVPAKPAGDTLAEPEYTEAEWRDYFASHAGDTEAEPVENEALMDAVYVPAEPAGDTEAEAEYTEAEWRDYFASPAGDTEAEAVEKDLFRGNEAGPEYTEAEWCDYVASQQLLQSSGVEQGCGDRLCENSNVKRAKSIIGLKGDATVKDPVPLASCAFPALTNCTVAEARDWGDANLPYTCRPSVCCATPDKWSWTWKGEKGNVRVVVNLKKKNFYVYNPKVNKPSVAWGTFPSLEAAWKGVTDQLCS
jgi:hypothetical protein